MKIEIDNEVFGFIESKVQGFGDTPNKVLRRLFNLSDDVMAYNKAKVPARRNPSTDLDQLVSCGYLDEGESLFFCDYQGKKSTKKAVIAGKRLEYQGKQYSMSNLAKILLKEMGYSSNSVQGPIFWCNEQGISIKDMWDKCLRTNS